MSTLVAITIFGIAFALFATQNTNLTTVQIGEFTWLIPVYVLAFIALLSGLLISWIINLFESLFNVLALAGKDNKIHQTQKSLEDLNLKVHELELENERIKSEQKIVIEEKRITDEGEEKVVHSHKSPSLMDRIRHTLSY